MQTTTQKEETTMMRIRVSQQRRIKIAAALRGKSMVDLLDEMLDHLEKQNGNGAKPTESK